MTICAGNSPVPWWIRAQRPVRRSFDVFFYPRLNKRLSRQLCAWWFETLSRPLLRHRNEHKTLSPCCVHNASTVPWTSAGQFGRPRGVRGRPWYDLWRPLCVISHPMDVRGLPPGRPPSGRPRDTQFSIDWSLLPSGCPQGVRTAEVQPITARTHYGQEVGLPTVRPKPEVDVP